MSYASVAASTRLESVGGQQHVRFSGRKKPDEVRDSNITAAKAVADAVRSSLGPKGMDKMIISANGDVMITNDGATILKQMELLHPVGKMLASLSKSQDVEAGDGTTTVVVLAGCLLDAAAKLSKKGIHPSIIAKSFQKASVHAVQILNDMSSPIDLSDKSALLESAVTSLSSKVVSQCSELLAQIAVNAVLKVMPTEGDDDKLTGAPSVNLKRIKILKRLGGTIDDTELVEGLVLDHNTTGYGGPQSMDKAHIALIQFCLSAPKTDMEHNVVISDHIQLDRALREEREYIVNIIKHIKKSGCNVLLIQKSILRDAANELALHLLAKAKIMVIKDIERDEVEFVCRALGCRPIASLDHFKHEAFGYAQSVERTDPNDQGRMVRFTGVDAKRKAVTIVLHASNRLLLDEAERSLHDALCTTRSLVKQPALVAGGGAPEIEMTVKLSVYADKELSGLEKFCVKEYADCLEAVPYTLAENAGLNAVNVVTDLRQRHANGSHTAGVSVRLGGVGDMCAEHVVQPLLISLSAISLATECVMQILKVDDFLIAAHM